ncbi:MAG: hypothetical protein ACI837_001148 [Crocinitomicaceae bacterium]|jgi:hypothetical protein
MQKKNRVIILTVVVVAVTALSAAVIKHYGSKNSGETEIVESDSLVKVPANQSNTFFKVDTARRQMRINRRAERKRVQDSIKDAEKNSVN